MKRFIAVAIAVCLAAPAAARQPASPPGKLVALNGIQMHYEEVGSGEPLLLLHGFGMCARGEWGDFVEELSKTHRLIMPDLRGHGWSTNPSNAFSMRQSAEDIRALLDHLGIDRIRAMGVSAGGMTLLHLALKHPERVERMVLIGATSHFPEQARKVLSGAAAAPPPPDVIEFMRRCASRGDEQIRSLNSQFVAFGGSYEDMNLNPPYLATIKAPTLIIHGDRDEFFPVSIATEMYESIPGSELWIVPNGDHVPIFGAREPEFLRITEEFLKRAPKSP